MLLSPIPESGAAKAITPYLQKYLYFFEFTPKWNFFAPDPGPPIFADYELLGRDGDVVKTGHWPESPNPYFFSDRQTRRAAMVRFITETPENEERLMVPYLCRAKGEHGEAVNAVRLWRSAFKMHTLEEFKSEERKPASEDGMRFLVSLNFCDTPKTVAGNR